MISFFRRMIGSKFGAAFALLFLILVAFAFIAGDVGNSGGSGSLLSFGRNSSVKVGGQTLTDTEIQSRVQMVFQQQRSDNPGMQIGDFLAMNAVPSIYDRLIAATALQEFGTKQGIHVSKRMIDAEIARIPAFQDATGKFNQGAFQQALSAQKISEQALRDDIAKQLVGGLLTTPTGFGARLPRSMALPYASLLLEAREGRIAAIPAAAFVPKDKPTDKQLQQFYASNAERYSIPEQRRLRYAIVDIARFDAAAKPSEAEIAKYYNAHRAEFAARETRSVSQLILPGESAAKAAAGAVSLAEAAKANGLSVATFDAVSKADFTAKSSPEAAALAFSTPRGKVAGPVKTPLGWALVETTAIQTTPARTLDQVRPEIGGLLQKNKQKTLLTDFIAKVEDRVANGETFDEAIKAGGLTAETSPLIIATGQSPDSPEFRPGPDLMPLLKPGFDMDADDDAQFVPIAPDQRYALLDVADVVAPAPPPLAKVKPLIERDYLLHAGNARAMTVADKVKADIAKGASLDKAMAAVGVLLPPVQKVGGRRADLLREDQRPPAEVSILFAMVQGSTKTVPIPGERGVFIVMLDRISQGDAEQVPGLVDRVRGDIVKVVAAEYGAQFERAVERDLGVKRDPALIDRVTAALRKANGAAQ